MTGRERLLNALEGKDTDRLPVTTHHILPYFLDKYFPGKSYIDFFSMYGFDPIRWEIPVTPRAAYSEELFNKNAPPEFLQLPLIVSPSWKVKKTVKKEKKIVYQYFSITTPDKQLNTILCSNDYTTWVKEPILKEKEDIDIMAKYQPVPLCDVEKVNYWADSVKNSAILRSFIVPFDIFGQPGCWQDFCCIRGTEKAIFDVIDDPQWVHHCLKILLERKLIYTGSLRNARYDIIELGGGDGSTTVISPGIFNEFVAPYDTEIIDEAHRAGQRIVYHICGGIMPILNDIVGMGPDAVETFSPKELGGDADLRRAKKIIDNRCCMIGGFNQAIYLNNCSIEETKAEVRKCFEEAGGGGGYILAPSDHFFDADPELIKVFVEEAQNCLY